MRLSARKVALFGLLTALALILGLMDRAIPLTALLGGAVPGIKLGLANTVLLYAVYLMDWKSSVLLMLTKVMLSGFLFGSLNAVLYSLAGGILSLGAMLLIRKKPENGALGAALAAAAAGIWMLIRTPRLKGQKLWIVILIWVSCIAAFSVFLAIRRGKLSGVMGTSLTGAVMHNCGQMLVAGWMLHAPQLLITYLPVLVGAGAAVGCLTGLITERVLAILRIQSKWDRRN